MKLRTVTAATLLALAASTSAQAVVQFTFDPTGTAGAAGDISNVVIIDQAPGSAYAEGGVAAIQNFAAGGTNTSFTLYYQANLSAMQGGDTSNLFSNGAGGNYFTFVAGFGEKVLSVGANQSATFGFDSSNSTNFFKMYATNTLGNNLTGVGFATGTEILSGHIGSIASSNFTVSSTTPTNLDQSFNGDNWAGQKTVTGSGTTDINLIIDTLDNAYFPTLDTLDSIILAFFNTSQVDPFKTVDPSKCFNTASGTCDAGTGLLSVGTLGDLNGATGPSFEFQADGNTVISVPEPGSIALVGLGLLLAGFRRRRAS